MRGVTLVVVVISPTKVQLQAVRALMVKHHYKDNDVCIKHHLLAKHRSFSMEFGIYSEIWGTNFNPLNKRIEYSYSPKVESFFRGTFTLLAIYVCVCGPNIVTARGQ